MATINVITGNLDKRGRTPIIVEYTHKGERFRKTIGRTDEEFDKSSGLTTDDELNQKIFNYKDKLRKALLICEAEERAPTLQNIRRFMNTIEYRTHNLMFVYNEYLRSKTTISPGYFQSLISLRKILNNYIKKHGPVAVNNVDGQFRIEFLQGLLDGSITGNGEPHSNNTISRVASQMQDFFNFCIESDYITGADKNISNFSKYIKSSLTKKKPKEKTALLEEEIEALSRVKTQKPKEQYAKDIALFLIDTGLRFSDISRLRPSHIHVSKMGKTFLKTATKKRGTTAIVPLSEKAIEIIERYSNADRLFPRKLRLDYFNAKLKEFAKEAGLNREHTFEIHKGNKTEMHTKPLHEIISSHFGRVTAATELIRDHGIYKASKILGHASVATTQRYEKGDASSFIDSL